MGVTLDYCTATSVPANVKHGIEAEALQLSPDHGWWAESINFFDPGEGDGRLYGGTKIFLIGYSTADGRHVEVDPDDDSLMAYRDSCYILERLAQWSQKYDLTWQVDCAGEPIGTVVKGQRDRQIRAYIESMKQSFPWPLSFEDKVKAISAKYASRW